MLHEACDRWSVAVLTVAVHSSFFPTFDFFKKYVAFCTGYNLLTPIFLLPYIIMDLPIFVYISIWLCTLEMNSSVHKARKYQWSLHTIIFVVSMQFLCLFCEIDKQNFRASERLRLWIGLHMIK